MSQNIIGTTLQTISNVRQIQKIIQSNNYGIITDIDDNVLLKADCVTNESYSFGNDITNYKIENISVADGLVQRPTTISISFVFSKNEQTDFTSFNTGLINSIVDTRNLNLYADQYKRLREKHLEIEKLVVKTEFYKLRTFYKTWDKVIIENISINITSETIGLLVADFDFKVIPVFIGENIEFSRQSIEATYQSPTNILLNKLKNVKL